MVLILAEARGGWDERACWGLGMEQDNSKAPHSHSDPLMKKAPGQLLRESGLGADVAAAMVGRGGLLLFPLCLLLMPRFPPLAASLGS